MPFEDPVSDKRVMLRRRWDSLPIVYKLFVTLVGGIAAVIVTLLAYVWGHESELMLKKEQEILHAQSVEMAQELNAHVSDLHKEIVFLSHLEVMEDVVVGDMDRRITQILEQKAADWGESVVVFVVSPEGTIPAASDAKKINTRFHEVHAVSAAMKRHQPYLYAGKNLYLFSPLYGSFYTEEFLGYVVVSYPLENFALRLKTTTNLHRWLVPPPFVQADYAPIRPELDEDDYLHEDIALRGIMAGWVLHYAMPKSEALALLYHLQTVFLSAFAIGLAVISFLVWFITLRIIRPLRTLSDTAMTIAVTGDYSQTVHEEGNDEIGTLAYSFNALMFSTLISMKRLEIERENYSDKLVSLIGFFNAITRAATKEETIEIAMEEIRRFSNAEEVYYRQEQIPSEDKTVVLDMHESGSEGAIYVRNPELHKESNERFYAALEKMVVLQIERIALMDKTRSALEAKSAFLSAMSHELRTPLGSVLSLTQYLMTQPQTPEPMGETLGKIENSAYHLLGVINTILELAKAESGKMEPRIESCHPVQLIERALELVEPLAEEKGLIVTTSLEPYDEEFFTDPRLFGQVIINLLSNAIKYTPSGSIHIALHHHDGGGVVEIIDTGSGIAQDALAHLFDEFYRVRSKESDGSVGSGLGLAISKRIALLLQGDLFIRSDGEGKGTTAAFHFRSF